MFYMNDNSNEILKYIWPWTTEYHLVKKKHKLLVLQITVK